MFISWINEKVTKLGEKSLNHEISNVCPNLGWSDLAENLSVDLLWSQVILHKGLKEVSEGFLVELFLLKTEDLDSLFGVKSDDFLQGQGSWLKIGAAQWNEKADKSDA